MNLHFMDYGKQSVTDPHMYNAYFLFFIYRLLRQPWRSVYSMFYNQRYVLKIKKTLETLDPLKIVICSLFLNKIQIACVDSIFGID